jgi:predicted membrane protein
MKLYLIKAKILLGGIMLTAFCGYFASVSNVLVHIFGKPLAIIFSSLGTIIAIMVLYLLYISIKQKMKNNKCKPIYQTYQEIYFDIECTPRTIRHLNNKNINMIRNLGEYSKWLDDVNNEVFCELLIVFKKAIIISDYKIDIIKTFGKIENPYITHSFGSGENKLCDKLIFKIGNIDINNGRYRIQFLAK